MKKLLTLLTFMLFAVMAQAVTIEHLYVAGGNAEWNYTGLAEVPFDEEKPAYTSGIRLGTPAMTTRGFKEEEFTEVARIISLVGHHIDDPESIEEAADRVKKLMDRFER